MRKKCLFWNVFSTYLPTQRYTWRMISSKIAVTTVPSGVKIATNTGPFLLIHQACTYIPNAEPIIPWNIQYIDPFSSVEFLALFPTNSLLLYSMVNVEKALYSDMILFGECSDAYRVHNSQELNIPSYIPDIRFLTFPD